MTCIWKPILFHIVFQNINKHVTIVQQTYKSIQNITLQFFVPSMRNIKKRYSKNYKYSKNIRRYRQKKENTRYLKYSRNEKKMELWNDIKIIPNKEKYLKFMRRQFVEFASVFIVRIIVYERKICIIVLKTPREISYSIIIIRSCALCLSMFVRSASVFHRLRRG